MKHSLVVPALLLLLVNVARAADDGGVNENDVELAKAHFNTGQIDYDKGRFIEAAHEFEEAYRLSGKSLLLYNMGKSYDGASDFARALGAYRRFMSTVSQSNDRKFAENRVQLLETLVGHITLAGAVAGSSIILDGNTIGKAPLTEMTVNPGHHSLELQHEGYANFKSGVDVPVGGTTPLEAKQVELVKVVRVEVPEKRTPVYKKWWLWTAVGGALAAGGVVAAVLLTTKSSTSGLDVQLPAVR
jgi:tetratricopeptide (TPR) repeat protein